MARTSFGFATTTHIAGNGMERTVYGPAFGMKIQVRYVYFVMRGQVGKLSGIFLLSDRYKNLALARALRPQIAKLCQDSTTRISILVWDIIVFVA